MPIKLFQKSGGVERVCDILQNGFLQRNISVCSYFIESHRPLKNNEYKIAHSDQIVCEDNIRQFCEILIQWKVQIILCQTHIGEQLRLCIEVKKRLPVKIVYSFHRNPMAGVKEYSDYKDKVLNSSNHGFRPLIKCKLYFGYPFFLIKNSHSHQTYRNYNFSDLDAFVTLSPSYKNYFVKHIAKSYRDKIYSISNPLRIEDYRNTSAKKKQILFVGRLTYQKRLDRLLEMWESIHKQIPDWSLLILGDGEYSNKYKTLSHNRDLKNVSFIGNVSPFRYYRESSIICMTSSYEGLPMVLIEAQNYGCIPIAYNSFNALTDIITDGHNGFYVPAFRKKEYINKVVMLAQDEKLRKKMSQNAIVSVDKFSDKKIVKKWIKLFEQI